MDRIEALRILHGLENLLVWSADEGNEDDEAIFLLALNLKNSFAALAMMLGLLDHNHICDTCGAKELERLYDDI